MKKTILILTLILSSLSLFSQSNYQDVVYLKDGSIYRGIILEQIPNESIKLEIVGKNLIVFKMEDMVKMTREPISIEKSNSVTVDDGQSNSYRGLFELGYDIGIGDNGISRFKLNIINGFQVNPHFSVGFGTGIRYFQEAEALYIPLFLDLRASILDKDVSPYVAIGTGYSMRVTNSFDAGFMLNPTAGVTFKKSSKSSMNIGFGYDLLLLNDNGFGALSFNLGFSF
jgi:hypothetical protein